MKHWLVKSEPGEYSIDDFAQEKRAIWDGVRNHLAKRHLMAMQPGDLVLFYHSGVKPPGVIGLARVSQAQIPDPTQFDPGSKYFDPKATPEAPRWITVELEHLETFPRMVPITELRERFSPQSLILLRRGNRLSVMPVPEEIFGEILRMAGSRYFEDGD